jgi:hypothetical protein
MINPNRRTELEGVDFVRAVVRNVECSFQEFSHHNDQGNDCYIEFVQDLIPTNYGVFVQIKSGPSFKDSLGYKIPSDKRHLQYWNRNLYKTIGIVYDTDLNKAFWVDISEYLKANPNVVSQETHTIRVSVNSEFSVTTFATFMSYCFRYKQELQDFEHFGRSLELFSKVTEPNDCYEGMKALYSTHRAKSATWFYITSTFAKIQEEGIRLNIIGLLSNYFNPNILWHRRNIDKLPTKHQVQMVKQALAICFREREIESLISYMKDGIPRGSFPYLVYLVVDACESAPTCLKNICFSDHMDEDHRDFCIWLYMHIAKYHSIEETIRTTELYLKTFPSAKNDEAIIGVFESIKKGELYPAG